MTSSSTLAARVADYFFVAGLHDNHVMPAYEAAKKNQKTSDDDNEYYQQQAKAVATNGASNSTVTLSESPPTMSIEEIRRRRGYSVSALSTNNKRYSKTIFPDIPENTASLLGVLDHVQHVIDNFDKDRDTARDSVIAVHDPAQITRHDSDKTIQLPLKSSHSENTSRKSSFDSTSRRWRRPSDPKLAKNKRFSLTAASTRSSTESVVEPEVIPSIFDVKYTPTILTRYPQKDYSPEEPFPAYAAMFCFPRDISLYHGDAPPPERYHSFTMTDETGSTVYGSCIVFYEKLPEKLKDLVNKSISEWKKANMSVSTVEYAEHLLEKIQYEEMRLEQVKKEYSDSFDGLSNILAQQHKTETDEIIRTCQENLALYRELLEPVKMGVCQADDIWVPKSIGLLGRMSWINLYGDWLRILLDSVVGVGGHRNEKPAIDIKSAVINFIEEVPLPPPGRFEIGLTINQRPLFFSRPPVNQVPILKNFSLFPLFRALSPHLILAILETLLAEGKVIFLSQYTGMLSLACESFRYLLFPLYWQFVFIPVLPERLLTCLQAPVPYMIGFPGTLIDLDEHVPDDACIVNLDSNTMHQRPRSMLIPDRQRRKLHIALEQYAPLHTRSKVPYGVPLSVQVTYPKGKLMLNCGRSKTTDVFISPAQQEQPRNSEASDTPSLWSHSTSLISRQGLWSSNASTRSSNDSTASLPAQNEASASTPTLPQFPGSAMLSTSAGNYSPSSKSPPMTPLYKASSLQSMSALSLSHSSPQQRSSLPPPATASPTLDGYKANRISEPPVKNMMSTNEDDRHHNSSMTNLSAFMIKPRAVFQHNQDHTNKSNYDSSPSISVSSPRPSNAFDSGYHNEIPRRVKHIEGHFMAELFTSELARFQGYRCVCGKQVAKDEEDIYRKPRMFMCCQECHLVTHDTCTSQILHPCLPACFDEQKVQDSFIRMFASLLYNYRTGFVDNLEESSFKAGASRLYFSKEKFLKHSDKDTRTFLSNLANSQMFTQFITDRLTKSSQEPEILLFDEYIKLKLNRSKLKFVKEETPFLNDDSFRVTQIIWSTPPEGTLSTEEFERFPVNLDFQ